MEILYNQYFKSGARGTAFAREKASMLDFIENDTEHHDIGFKYDDESEAKNCSQNLRMFLKKKFSRGYVRFRCLLNLIRFLL